MSTMHIMATQMQRMQAGEPQYNNMKVSVCSLASWLSGPGPGALMH